MTTNNLHTKTLVLSSARAIRHEQLKLPEHSLFLPNFLTMADFISKLCRVDDFTYMDEDSRTLLLLEASNFKAFSALEIERNFFTFTKNSSYIFKFFEELSAEKYDIKTLNTSDIYAEYEEHITILQELYKRYEVLCYEKKLLDKIFLPKLYTFNSSFLKNHQHIELHIDGYLTNFELELLLKCANFANVNIIFSTSYFNEKMQNKLAFFLDVKLEVNKRYTISLNEKKIIQIQSLDKNTNIICESLSEALLQVAFVKHKVFEFIKKGYDPQKIVVVLPEESRANSLRSFDIKTNLNFAMGKPFVETFIYQKLSASEQLLMQNSQENIARIQRVGIECYTLFLPHYYKKVTEIDFIGLLHETKNYIQSKVELKIFEQEIYSFEKVLSFMEEMSVKSLLNLFLKRLAKQTLDDVSGGKITVMGVLETRGIHFDGVIIVDFNDNYVPRKSDKDMFLNTTIRKNASLPTMSDRQNLQKHYYKMLLDSSKEVYISYVDSSDTKVSRFLKQLGIETQLIYNEADYAKLLFSPYKQQELEEKDIVLEYSFKDVPLSSTRLKNFLSCKRKYYYKYIKHINSHQIAQDIPKEHDIGIKIHAALKDVYSEKKIYTKKDELQRTLSKALDKQKGSSEFERYLFNFQKKHLESFCEYEVERFSQNIEVAYTEVELSREFKGIKIVGKIDRIDKTPHGLEVLDYKTGKLIFYTKNSYKEATDFQLEFYYLLAQTLGEVKECGFYDLKEIGIVSEKFFQEKMELLEEKIAYLLSLEKINFEKTSERKNCSYCEYATLCQRD